MADEKLPESAPAPARRCRGDVPRRGGRVRSPLVVRHRGNTLTIGVRPRPARPVVAPARGLALAAFAAVLLLVAAVTGLFTVRAPAPARDAGPCPDRTSITLADAGQTLRIRPEPAPGTTLIHLCADQGTVRHWSVTTADGSALVVQTLGDRLAIAAAPAGDLTLTVRTERETGRAATFRAVLDLP
jgi:hypothetical protein